MVNYSKHPNPSRNSFIEGMRARAQHARYDGVQDPERDPRLSVEAWAIAEGEVENEDEPPPCLK